MRGSRLAALIPFFAVSALSVSAQQDFPLPPPQIASAEGKAAPDFQLKDQASQFVSLSTLRGSKVLLMSIAATGDPRVSRNCASSRGTSQTLTSGISGCSESVPTTSPTIAVLVKDSQSPTSHFEPTRKRKRSHAQACAANAADSDVQSLHRQMPFSSFSSSLDFFLSASHRSLRVDHDSWAL